jgi:hypothetical protein
VNAARTIIVDLPVRTWVARDETCWGNGWVVLDPDWCPGPRRHYCSSERVARRLAAWKRGRTS